MNRYDDMLHLPHHESAMHPKMSRHNRAAQFMPFAALAGFTETIRERGRITSEKMELSQEQKDQIASVLTALREKEKTHPYIFVTYFEADKTKDGGAYLDVEGTLHRIDDVTREVILKGGKKIAIDDIFSVHEDDEETNMFIY